jgi:hypothetical protein
MERLRVPPVEDPDLVVEVEIRSKAVMRLVGSADNQATAQLADLIATLDKELRERGAKEIVVDLLALDFMAPSCVKLVLGWLRQIHALEPAQRYRITLRTNRSIAWQANTMPALSCFDTEILTIES